MYFLIYTSYAGVHFTGDDLKELLIQSRDKNKAISVTGMLLYFDGKFMQLIEGEKQDIKQLYETIRKDMRHHQVITLKEGMVKERFFEDWSMGFKSVSKEELAGEEGYKNLGEPGPDTSAAFKLFKILSVKNKGEIF